MFSKIKVPKKLITTVIVVLAIILVAFIVIKVVMGSENYVRFSNAGLNISDAKKSIGVIKNDAGLTEVANNGTLKLEYNPSDDLFVLTDLKTGKTIRSYPELTEEENLKYEKNPLGKKILTSPFKVNFSKSGNDRSADFFVNQTIHKKTVNKIENGVQLVYNLTETKVSLAIEFTIDGNAFEVKIPRNSIVEKSDISRIASVALLPYFDAARQEDYGYFVTPDGSGALTYFNANRVTNYDSYAKRIYGDDMTFARLISPDYKSKSITMSVYGIVKENHYVTTYIHDGDTNAALLISYPGDRTLPFYSTSFEYHFRQFYLTKLSKSGKDFELLEENITLGDVRQRY